MNGEINNSKNNKTFISKIPSNQFIENNSKKIDFENHIEVSQVYSQIIRNPFFLKNLNNSKIVSIIPIHAESEDPKKINDLMYMFNKQKFVNQPFIYSVIFYVNSLDSKNFDPYLSFKNIQDVKYICTFGKPDNKGKNNMPKIRNIIPHCLLKFQSTGLIDPSWNPILISNDMDISFGDYYLDSILSNYSQSDYMVISGNHQYELSSSEPLIKLMIYIFNKKINFKNEKVILDPENLLYQLNISEANMAFTFNNYKIAKGYDENKFDTVSYPEGVQLIARMTQRLKSGKINSPVIKNLKKPWITTNPRRLEEYIYFIISTGGSLLDIELSKAWSSFGEIGDHARFNNKNRNFDDLESKVEKEFKLKKLPLIKHHAKKNILISFIYYQLSKELVDGKRCFVQDKERENELSKLSERVLYSHDEQIKFNLENKIYVQLFLESLKEGNVLKNKYVNISGLYKMLNKKNPKYIEY